MSEESTPQEQSFNPVDKYQQLLDDAQDMRRKGAINSGELAVIAVIIRGIFALGMDITTDIDSLRNNGIPDSSTGGEGETAQMDIPFEGDSGDESTVRPPVPQG